MAYLILQNSKNFNSSLTKWDRRDNYKSWDDFMIFFRKEQKNMRRTGELTLSETLNKDDFVNLLSEGIKEGVESALAAREQEMECRNDNETLEEDSHRLVNCKRPYVTINY